MLCSRDLLHDSIKSAYFGWSADNPSNLLHEHVYRFTSYGHNIVLESSLYNAYSTQYKWTLIRGNHEILRYIMYSWIKIRHFLFCIGGISRSSPICPIYMKKVKTKSRKKYVREIAPLMGREKKFKCENLRIVFGGGKQINQLEHWLENFFIWTFSINAL